MQITQERGKIQLLIQRSELVVVRRTYLQILGRKLHGDICSDCGQGLREQQLVAPRENLLALLALDSVCVSEDVLALAPLANQLAGTLLANAWHAGDVVRRIAPDSQNISHQNGVRDAILCANILRTHNLHAIALLLVEVATLANQLTVILVGRYHIYIIPLGRCSHSQRADNIVSLKAFNLVDGYAHSLQQTTQVGHRGDNILGCCGAVSLVFGVEITAETASLWVERHAQQVGRLTLLNISQELRKAEQDRGVHSVAVAHRTTKKGVVIFEYERIGVDKEKAFHRSYFTNYPRRTTRHTTMPSRADATSRAPPRRATTRADARQNLPTYSRT